VLVAAAAAMIWSCGPGPSHPGPLAHAHASPESLASEVLDAVQRRDRATLGALAVSEEEFRLVVWPRLPAARPERNLPISYVWGDLRQKSDASLAETLARHGGAGYRLIGVRFAGTTDYGGYRVHRDATFAVTDPRGRPADLRLIGSMLQRGSGWKVFSYVVDD
jgi:hypothetical protein